MSSRRQQKYTLDIRAQANGRIRTAEVFAFDESGTVLAAERGDLMKKDQREKLAAVLAEQLQVNREKLAAAIEKRWLELLTEHRQQEAKAAAGHPDAAAAGPGSGGEKPLSAATRLVRMVQDAGVELVHTPEQRAYVLITSDGRRQCWPLRSRAFRSWCQRLFYQAEGRGLAAQAVEDALGVLDGKACFDGAERLVHVRLAEHEGRTYLDLGDDSWAAIEIGPTGWTLAPSPPVLFWRPRALLPLPRPTQGSLDALRGLLNLDSDADWRLIVAWLLQSLRATGSYPVLALAGEQGSCKSSAARLLRSLIDPNSAPLRAPPREVRDLMIAGANSWVIALDNLSRMPDWLSDLLCVLSTGGGYSTRELYSDGEETLFNVRRPCVLTSIEDVTTRGDLLDRAVSITLPPMRETGSEQGQRRAEREYLAAVDAARPGILGALLDAACAARRELPHVHIAALPRMADFAELGVAAEQALGWPAGAFLQAYCGNRAQAHQVSLDSSLIYPPLLALLEQTSTWQGTCTELLQALARNARDEVRHQREWPARPNVLSGQLRRLAPDLAAVGIDVQFPARTARSRVLTIQRQKQERDSASSSSSASSPGASPDPARTCTDDDPEPPIVTDDDPYVTDDDPEPAFSRGNDADDADDDDLHRRFWGDEAPF